MIDTPPKAVLFDCDGVLVDSEAIANRAFRDDLAERGLDLSEAEAMEIYAGRTMEDVAAEATRRGAWIEEGWVQQFYPKAFAALAEEVEAIPGVTGLVARLADMGVAMAVGSNGPVAKMEVTLGRAGLLPFFGPHVYSARDLAHPKPAPDIFLHAANALGVAPADCVVIDDGVSGVKAAQAAGIYAIGFGRGADAAKLAPYSDVVLGDMAEVERHLGL